MQKIEKGKVRDIYDLGDKLLLVTSDRVSAFDAVLPNTIPNKGAVLNRLSAFWFDYTKEIIPNHFISINNADMPEEFQSDDFSNRCMIVKKLTMLPIQCIVRGYISGTGWDSYQINGCVCGIKLPAGLKESQKLSRPIYTPTTKMILGHDEHISFMDTMDLVGEDWATQIRTKSLELYLKCSDYALKKGIIIADTKFEFGIDKNGVLTLADEILTPDSSRFWSFKEYRLGKTQNSFDRQYLIDYLNSSDWDKKSPIPSLPDEVIDVTSKKYIEAYEILTGTKF